MDGTVLAEPQRRFPRRALSGWGMVVAVLLAGCVGRTPPPAPRGTGLAREPDRRLGPISGTVHGAWVVRHDLRSPESVAAVVEAAERAGFNTLLVQVRGRGDAWYRSTRAPRARELAERPVFDPLTEVLRQAHARDIRVHAWMNVGLVAGAAETLAPGHVALQHPEWLSRPLALPTDAGVAELRAHARQESKTVEGLYAEPASPGYQDHLVSLVDEILAGYPVDGIHLDYIRHPRADFGRCPETLAALRKRVGATRRNDDELLKSHREDWNALLTEGVTALVRRVVATAQAHDRTVQVTAAVLPDLQQARRVHQDWGAWAVDLDAICPMNYAVEDQEFRRVARQAVQAVPAERLWMGQGSWRIPAATVSQRAMESQRSGVAGVLHFSLGGLRSEGRLEALIRETPEVP